MGAAAAAALFLLSLSLSPLPLSFQESMIYCCWCCCWWFIPLISQKGCIIHRRWWSIVSMIRHQRLIKVHNLINFNLHRKEQERSHVTHMFFSAVDSLLSSPLHPPRPPSSEGGHARLPLPLSYFLSPFFVVVNISTTCVQLCTCSVQYVEKKRKAKAGNSCHLS